MARVRLYLDQLDKTRFLRFIRPGGSRDAIPILRLKAYVELLPYVRPGPDAGLAAYPYCVLDTASLLSIIPEYIGSYLRRGVVTPLPFDPAVPAADRFLTVAGGIYPYELGEITLPLRDLAGGRLDARVVAMFTRDGGGLNIPLTLGLRGGVLDGRVLKAEPDPSAPFGQAWVLEDP